MKIGDFTMPSDQVEGNQISTFFSHQFFKGKKGIEKNGF